MEPTRIMWAFVALISGISLLKPQIDQKGLSIPIERQALNFIG